MKKNILTIGSLSFDIFLSTDDHKIISQKNKEYFSLPFGEKVKVSALHECFGGGAGNTAVGFNRLGITASPFGAIANDKWGDEIIKNFKKEGISTEYIQRIEGETGFAIILNSKDGERTILFNSGANHAIENIDEEILNKSDGVHLCHLSGESRKVFEKIKDYFIKNPNKFLSWNPGKEQLEKGVEYFKDFLPVVDILFINKEEAELFTGQKEDLFSFIPAKRVVITDGRNGATVHDGAKIHHYPVKKNSARIDTTGAGDAFAVGFSYGVLTKKDLPTCLSFGTMNAESVIQHFGAQKGLLKSF